MTTVRYTTVNGEVIAEKRGGVRKHYVPDPLGSTSALLDSTQTQTDTFVYWPYGESRSRTGSTPTPFQFVGTRGYYRDSGTRDYVRARYVDVAKTRWLTEDPLGLDGSEANPYRCVRNNPVLFIDPSGNGPTWGWNGWWVRRNQSLLHKCISAGLNDSNCCGLDQNKVSQMMRCIIGCELDNLRPGYNIMDPDPKFPKGGVGPSRLTDTPVYGGFTYPNNNWRSDPCDNIKAGISLLCYDIKNPDRAYKKHTKKHRKRPAKSYKLPSDWSGDQPCYDQCMRSVKKARAL